MASTNPKPSTGKRQQLPAQARQHLYDRFLKPNMFREPSQLMHFMERAHWHYCDELVPELKVPACNFQAFVGAMARSVGWRKENVKAHLTDFNMVSRYLDRCGGLLLNGPMDKVLMVKGVRGSRFWFPRGKIDYISDEGRVECAAREVKEETGYSGPMSARPISFRERSYTCYLFPFFNVPESFPFAPTTKNEIAEIKWMPVSLVGKRSSLGRQVQQVIDLARANASPYKKMELV